MKGGWLREAFLHNRGLKLVSILIALVLWIRVVGSEQSEGQFKVGLVLVNLPKELVLVGNVPRDINVRMTGPRAIMSTLDEKKLNFTLDLTGMREGSTAYEVLPSKLGLPRGVEVTQVSPSKLLLQSDRKIHKRLTVSPRLSGAPAPGYSMLSALVTPSEVEVEGAERSLRVMKEISTELVDVSNLSGGLARTVELSPPDPSIKVVNKTPLRLEVRIVELSGERGYQRVSVSSPVDGWIARPATVEVRLKGNPDALSRIKASGIAAMAVHEGSKPPRGPVPVRIQSPPGTAVVSVRPAEVLLVPAPEEDEENGGQDGGQEGGAQE